MLKRMIILCLILCTGFCGRPQNRRVHPLQADDLAYALGFKGGISFSDMYIKSNYPRPNTSNHSRQGVSLGMVYHRPLNAKWAFQPELVYSSQGYKVEWRDSVWTYREEVRHGYFNLPLLVQYLSPAGLSLYTGPQPGFLVFNQGDEFTSMDLSWVIGGAYLSKIGLGAEVRYNAGLINIASNDYDYLPFIKARNRVVQAGLVYLFAQAKKRSNE